MGFINQMCIYCITLLIDDATEGFPDPLPWEHLRRAWFGSICRGRTPQDMGQFIFQGRCDFPLLLNPSERGDAPSTLLSC